MDIEKIATNLVALSISKTEYLSPFINDGDKEPSWDGNIYAFYNTDKKKSHLSGRAPVQIKGTKNNNFLKSEITYLVEVSDLRNYLIDGGNIFFVVYINDNGEGKIYYSCLLPFIIHDLLEGSEMKKRKSIKLIEFPISRTEKDNIVLNFVRDRKKQFNMTEGKKISLDEITKLGNIDSYTVTFTNLGYDKTKPYEYMFNHGVFLYAEIKDLNIQIPVQYINNIEVASTRIEKQIYVGNKKFYDFYDVAHKKDCDEIHFGKSTVFVLNLKDTSFRINFKIKGNLKERIVDEEFLISIFEIKEVNIGNQKMPFNITEFEVEKLEIGKIKRHLHHLKLVDEVFNMLGVTYELDCTALMQRDEKYIQMLIAAIKYNEEIEFEEDGNIPPVAKINISNLQIMLIFQRLENGKYKISNFFKTKIGVYSIDSSGNKFDTSQFMLINEDNFCNVSNINFNEIEKSVFAVSDSEVHHNQANMLLLRMLKAYDMEAPQKQALLECAIHIAEWLKNKKIIPYEVSMINVMQCYLRKRQLTDLEIEKLYEIIECDKQKEMIKVAAYLLVGEHKTAKRHFEKLTDDEKKEFSYFPIYTFLKK